MKLFGCTNLRLSENQCCANNTSEVFDLGYRISKSFSVRLTRPVIQESSESPHTLTS